MELGSPPVPDGGAGPQRRGRSYCQVEGCTARLSKAYCLRYRVCQVHLTAPCVELHGSRVRFCQKCGRFEALDAFDGTKRSCREQLAAHNVARRERRREAAVQQSEAEQLSLQGALGARRAAAGARLAVAQLAASTSSSSDGDACPTGGGTASGSVTCTTSSANCTPPTSFITGAQQLAPSTSFEALSGQLAASVQQAHHLASSPLPGGGAAPAGAPQPSEGSVAGFSDVWSTCSAALPMDPQPSVPAAAQRQAGGALAAPVSLEGVQAAAARLAMVSLEQRRRQQQVQLGRQQLLRQPVAPQPLHAGQTQSSSSARQQHGHADSLLLQYQQRRLQQQQTRQEWAHLAALLHAPAEPPQPLAVAAAAGRSAAGGWGPALPPPPPPPQPAPQHGSLVAGMAAGPPRWQQLAPLLAPLLGQPPPAPGLQQQRSAPPAGAAHSTPFGGDALRALPLTSSVPALAMGLPGGAGAPPAHSELEALLLEAALDTCGDGLALDDLLAGLERGG
ncbi:SPL3 [Scenedesmus sp. PABB004]|nr:SPL3 [Scenedesmus sp. PABB004]